MHRWIHICHTFPLKARRGLYRRGLYRRGLYRQTLCQPNSALCYVGAKYTLCVSQHGVQLRVYLDFRKMSFSDSALCSSGRILTLCSDSPWGVWLGAVLVSIESDFVQCYMVWSLIPHSVSQRRVRLRSVLYSAESYISQISLQKRNYLKNHFSLLIKGLGGLIF